MTSKETASLQVQPMPLTTVHRSACWSLCWWWPSTTPVWRLWSLSCVPTTWWTPLPLCPSSLITWGWAAWRTWSLLGPYVGLWPGELGLRGSASQPGQFSFSLAHCRPSGQAVKATFLQSTHRCGRRFGHQMHVHFQKCRMLLHRCGGPSARTSVDGSTNRIKLK